MAASSARQSHQQQRVKLCRLDSPHTFMLGSSHPFANSSYRECSRWTDFAERDSVPAGIRQDLQRMLHSCRAIFRPPERLNLQISPEAAATHAG